MAEHDLDLRLRAVARALDAAAPAFDPTLLRVAPRRRGRPAVVALAIAATVAGLVGAPAALSGLWNLFDVDEVAELRVAPDVAPPYGGRAVSPEALQSAAPFRVETIRSLGPPTAAYTRDDIVGGMVTLAYDSGRILLTQWPADSVHARIEVVPGRGTAGDASVGRLEALWTEGTARGTFTLVGADGSVHRERFDVAAGALLWRDGDLAFLLQGAGPETHATKLAAGVGP